MSKAASTKELGTMVSVLLPSVKMKSLSSRETIFEREFHEFLLASFGGYTVASGNITGYWRRRNLPDECNEHRRYEISIKTERDRKLLELRVACLAQELGETSIFCQRNGKAYLIRSMKERRR